MTAIRIVDQNENIMAVGRATIVGSLYEGNVSLDLMRVEMRDLFDEFEEIVNGQMFSFLDNIQERVDSLALKVVFEDGRESCLQDLQIYPSTGDVSFKLAEVSARQIKSDH